MPKQISLGLNSVLTVILLLFCFLIPFQLLLSCDALYIYDLHSLQLDKQLHLSSDQLLLNYKKITQYLADDSIQELTLPHFPMSPQGRIHFEEVKKLFHLLKYVLIMCSSLFILGFFLLVRKKETLSFLKWTADGLLMLPILLAIPFLTSFEKSFFFFHQLLFNNEYWLFDPATDPIIFALPEEFFFHCAIVYLLLIMCFSAIFHLFHYRIYRTR